MSTRVTEEPFGVIKTSRGNQTVTKFTLTNENNFKMQLINYGAAITNLFVADKDGRLQDVVLGFDNLDGIHIINIDIAFYFLGLCSVSLLIFRQIFSRVSEARLFTR